jgi:hypothetical protein
MRFGGTPRTKTEIWRRGLPSRSFRARHPAKSRPNRAQVPEKSRDGTPLRPGPPPASPAPAPLTAPVLVLRHQPSRSQGRAGRPIGAGGRELDLCRQPRLDRCGVCRAGAGAATCLSSGFAAKRRGPASAGGHFAAGGLGAGILNGPPKWPVRHSACLNAGSPPGRAHDCQQPRDSHGQWRPWAEGHVAPARRWGRAQWLGRPLAGPPRLNVWSPAPAHFALHLVARSWLRTRWVWGGGGGAGVPVGAVQARAAPNAGPARVPSPWPGRQASTDVCRHARGRQARRRGSAHAHTHARTCVPAHQCKHASRQAHTDARCG